jgi:hypothetical protein
MTTHIMYLMAAYFDPHRQAARLPEQPVSPPEISDEEYDRNVRNACRRDAIKAIDTLLANLEELHQGNWFQDTQADLDELRDYLERDMED